MNVAIVCGGGIVSGKEIMVLQLADGLRDAGMKIEVVSSHWSDGKFGERLAERKIPTHKVWFGFISATLNLSCVYMSSMQMLRLPHLLAGYYNFLRRFQPEKVIHTNWHSLLVISPLLRKDREIYWVHEVMPDKPQYRKVFRWFDRRLKCFVAVSQAVADSLCRLGISRDRIRVIYNGLDSTRFALSESVGSSESINIGIAGQVGAWKGHEDLLNAFAMVAKGFPAARLQIFGKGNVDYEDLLRVRAAELDLTNRVEWRGFIADPATIYGNLSVLVVPSRSEDALPTVAIEAAFFGVPVIASSSGGLREIVEHEKTGFLFEAGKVEKMAEYLGKLLADAALRVTLGRNARLRAEELFSRERFMRSFGQVLQE